jgi:hypothetical protein
LQNNWDWPNGFNGFLYQFTTGKNHLKTVAQFPIILQSPVSSFSTSPGVTAKNSIETFFILTSTLSESKAKGPQTQIGKFFFCKP